MTQGTIVGYFPSRKSADSAITALKEAGFTREDIGLAIRSGTETGTERAGEHHEASMWERIKAFFGGESESYSEERPRDKVDDRSSYSYNYDDVHRSLSGLAVTDEQARYFRHRFGSGTEGAIVTVSAAGRGNEARRILEENGGDVGASAANYDYGRTGMETGRTYSEAERVSGDVAGEQNVRLYGEVLRVHTDRVNRGEARLRTEVHTTNQTVEVPVKREELVVERMPVEGERAAGSEASFKDKEIRIPLSEERARVEKEPVVREDVRVGKKEVTDTKKFDEKVRSEELKVDEDVRDKRKSA